MEEELAMDNKKDSSPLEKTSSVVKGLLERTDLLLRVTIAPEAGMSFTRSMSHLPEINRQGESKFSTYYFTMQTAKIYIPSYFWHHWNCFCISALYCICLIFTVFGIRYSTLNFLYTFSYVGYKLAVTVC